MDKRFCYGTTLQNANASLTLNRGEQKQSEKREAREIGRERNLLVWTMNLSRLSDGANPVPESENLL